MKQIINFDCDDWKLTQFTLKSIDELIKYRYKIEFHLAV